MQMFRNPSLIPGFLTGTEMEYIQVKARLLNEPRGVALTLSGFYSSGSDKAEGKGSEWGAPCGMKPCHQRPVAAVASGRFVATSSRRRRLLPRPPLPGLCGAELSLAAEGGFSSAAAAPGARS